jgi:hypothetical protein
LRRSEFRAVQLSNRQGVTGPVQSVRQLDRLPDELPHFLGGGTKLFP